MTGVIALRDVGLALLIGGVAFLTGVVFGFIDGLKVGRAEVEAEVERRRRLNAGLPPRFRA